MCSGPDGEGMYYAMKQRTGYMLLFASAAKHRRGSFSYIFLEFDILFMLVIPTMTVSEQPIY